uniref:Uncharacterized protein n=1 Tax=Chaetoceros debilis TaxID=122233 RepID=A0A7S3V8U9_9STRA|mmetsp:Transcript_4079/g.6017  ORF Transcript_4079/g.6017 Transcript_4079/m.6017 type:complete len:159 (+) Transcript_4079:104-580(+)|eukprot:CAMPEP_0194083362 /NCGR_PEP_ID=MMETSP0149-20130528/9078_1 /TAXON_ID=122233 /ORGANISM="Chaetoceros debilis, Strain MM31A-1" /LENGTH=158 /DNA_ID=CAMNT_0038765755 /DNA_START=62 /DNA_END=538 /DNA_ORIENTATION=+
MISLTTTFTIILATLNIAQGSSIHRNMRKLEIGEITGAEERKLEDEYASTTSTKAPYKYYEYDSSKNQTDTSSIASASSANYLNVNYIKENKKYHPIGIMIGVVAGISFIVLGASKAKKRQVKNNQLNDAIYQQDDDLESRFESVAKLTTVRQVLELE